MTTPYGNFNVKRQQPVSVTYALIQLLGAVALLLWGLKMIRTGITRGFGAQLRHVISGGVGNRAKALVAGMGVTMIVQSSTATALIVVSFVSNRIMGIAPALAVMLGADIATTLVAQLLSLDLSLLSPVLLLGGVIMHKSFKRTLYRQIGRATIGLGLMLLALAMIVGISEPLRDSYVLQVLFASLSDDPIVALLLAAMLTWLAHSSLAIVLLVMAFTAVGVMTVPLALAMVLGANLGGAMPPIMATLNEGVLARRVTLTHGAFKLIGVATVLPFIGYLQTVLMHYEIEPMRQVVNFHTAFNVLLALVFIFVIPTAAKMAARLFPLGDLQGLPEHRSFLDQTAIETPAVGLSCAAREALRMGEYVERMVRGLLQAIKENDQQNTDALVEMDDLVDQECENIKRYVTEIARQEIDESESKRITEILSFVTNLEHVGDIAENLLVLVLKKARHQLNFSDEGMAELTELHEKVTTNLKLSMAVFMSGDIEVARKLMVEKYRVDRLETRFAENHMKRLCEGRHDSIEVSALYMDMLRDLRRIHAHISAVAYPILDAAGALRKSRLRKKRSKEENAQELKNDVDDDAED